MCVWGGGQCFCATQHFVAPLNNHVVPKKCPGMHTDSMQIFNQHQTSNRGKQNDIFVPKFRCCLFSVPNLVSLSAAEGFQKESVQQLKFKKKEIIFQRKTNPSYIRLGDNPSLLQLWTVDTYSCNLFFLSDKKESRFFFTTKTIKLGLRDKQGVFLLFSAKNVLVLRKVKVPKLFPQLFLKENSKYKKKAKCQNCSSWKI